MKKVFNTVADMKAAHIPVGVPVRTLGCDTAGDGGGADYLTEPWNSPDGYGDHTLASGNQATLLVTDSTTAASFGAKADGVTNDSAAVAAMAAALGYVHIGPGTHLLSGSTISVPVRFSGGGTITGTGILIDGPISAAAVQIFESSQDFTASAAAFVADPYIRVFGNGSVYPDWFGAERCASADDILDVSDSSNYILQAFRAIAGNYETHPSKVSAFLAEHTASAVALASGHYRTTKAINWGTYYNGNNYWVSGIGMFGCGTNASVIVCTEANLGEGIIPFNVTLFEGEINPFAGFKVTHYNPDNPSPFAGEYPAVIGVGSGDSATFSGVWASGAQVGVDDSDGFLRNGAGWQFVSCIDVQLVNCFSEHNLYNYAIHSSTVSISNAVGFASDGAQILFGIANRAYSYPVGAATSVLNINGAEFKATSGTAILAVESGGVLNLSDGYIDGTQEGTGTAVGHYVVKAINASDISGCVSNIYAKDFVYGLARAEDTASLGNEGRKLNFIGGNMYGITSTSLTGYPGLVSTAGSSSTYNDVTVRDYSLDLCWPQLAFYSGHLVLDNITLRSFFGTSDSGNYTSYMTIVNGNDVYVNNIKRVDNTTQAISQIAYIAAGDMYVDHLNLENTTRSIGKGGGANAYMHSVTTFV